MCLEAHWKSFPACLSQVFSKERPMDLVLQVKAKVVSPTGGSWPLLKSSPKVCVFLLSAQEFLADNMSWICPQEDSTSWSTSTGESSPVGPPLGIGGLPWSRWKLCSYKQHQWSSQLRHRSKVNGKPTQWGALSLSSLLTHKAHFSGLQISSSLYQEGWIISEFFQLLSFSEP